MDVVIRSCAGLDVHKETVVVCLRTNSESGQVRKAVRTYRTTTQDLSRLADWLVNEGVTCVAMESTGVYWKPIFNVFEDRPFRVMLCNAQHVKQVPGRKTDVKDCEWIADLLQHGLLKASFVPARHLRELRDLTRHRTKLSDQQTAVVNRIHKTLEDANIKLSSVATDILGVSGRAMIEALIRGVTSPAELANLARSRLRGKMPELQEAMEGRVREHHRFMLERLWTQLRFLEDETALLDKRVEQVMKEADAQEAAPKPEPPSPGGGGGEGESDPVKPAVPTFRKAIEILETLPGIRQRAAENILAEIGTDMSQFPLAKNLASWAGVCPGNNESGGKKRSGATRKGNRWLRRALNMAAWGAARTKETYFNAAYRRWAGRRGGKRATVAVGHALLVTIHAMLQKGQPFSDLGPKHFDKLDPARLTRYHVKRLKDLGYRVTIEEEEEAA